MIRTRVRPDEVLALVASETGVSSSELSLGTTLFGDLGVDGDDADELLSSFATWFSVDMSGCDLSLHFGTEGLPPRFPLYGLILWLRRGTPEERNRLLPVRISDLVTSAELKQWTVDSLRSSTVAADRASKGTWSLFT